MENLGARSSAFNKFRQEFNCLKGIEKTTGTSNFRTDSDQSKNIRNTFRSILSIRLHLSNLINLSSENLFYQPRVFERQKWVPLFFHSGSMKVSEGLTFIKIIRLFGKFFRFFFCNTLKVWFISKMNWLVVSTHLKNISQNGNLPQIGVKINI